MSKTAHDHHLFRTYGTRASGQNISIVDACLATSAATTFFPSVTVDHVEYVDGAFKCNNPTSSVLKELESRDSPSPMRDAIAEIDCLVSIGTGRPTIAKQTSTSIPWITPKGVSEAADAAAMCVKIATNCHEAHLDIEYR